MISLTLLLDNDIFFKLLTCAMFNHLFRGINGSRSHTPDPLTESSGSPATGGQGTGGRQGGASPTMQQRIKAIGVPTPLAISSPIRRYDSRALSQIYSLRRHIHQYTLPTYVRIRITIPSGRILCLLFQYWLYHPYIYQCFVCQCPLNAQRSLTIYFYCIFFSFLFQNYCYTKVHEAPPLYQR